MTHRHRPLLCLFAIAGLWFGQSGLSLAAEAPPKPADSAPKEGQPQPPPAKEEPKKEEPKKDAAPKPEPKPEPAKEKPAEKPAAPAPEAKDAKKEPAKDAAETTAKVKKGTIRLETTVDGVFEAQNMTEIAVRLQEWAGLSVLKAVEHGAAVKRGDLILAFDTEKIDRMIADTQADLKVGEIAMQQTDLQMQALEKLAPMDAEAVERSHRVAQEDFKQFFDVDKPLSLKATEFMLQSAKDYVEYEEEELKQLEKMYKADDLVEETEAIVLKRARDAVKKAKFAMERAQAQHDEMLKFTLPRYDEKVKDGTARAEIEWNRSKITLPLAASKQKLEYEKLKVQRGLAEERLKKLLADRAAMTIKAPADGIVYYGKCSRGRWTGGAAGGETLRRGATAMPNEVVMTLVEPRPLSIRGTLPEAQVQNVKVGTKGVVEAAVLGSTRLMAVVQRVSAVPISAGSFDIQFAVAMEPAAEVVMPGMSCEVKMVTYKKADALTVPPKAVTPDDENPQKMVVYLVGKDGKPERREVTIGKRTDKQVEILAGLAENDQVLLERPKE